MAGTLSDRLTAHGMRTCRILLAQLKLVRNILQGRGVGVAVFAGVFLCGVFPLGRARFTNSIFWFQHDDGCSGYSGVKYLALVPGLQHAWHEAESRCGLRCASLNAECVIWFSSLEGVKSSSRSLYLRLSC
jgi:hypothetical protein